jgi:hypothetical protein
MPPMTRRSIRAQRLHRMTAVGLWMLVVYLLILYLAFRFGSHSSPNTRYPGSD